MRRRPDALGEAAAQVASLRAALSVAAASEEALRHEVDSAQQQLLQFQDEEAHRFQHSMRAQAEQMRLRVRIGELSEASTAKDAIVAAATTDVSCLQREVHTAEARVEDCMAELKGWREHAEMQITALHAARESEGTEHRERVTALRSQLDEFEQSVSTSRRVDPRLWIEMIDPVCRRLGEALNHELEMSAAVGRTWATSDVEAACAEAARAAARVASAEQAMRDERARRSACVRQAEEAVRASMSAQLDEMKDYVGSLVSELQEKDAAARASQQTVLAQLAKERASFHSHLKALQKELAAARGETARGQRVVSHLVAKVMDEWARRRAGRVLLAWRAEIVRARRLAAAEREAEAHERQIRLNLSAALVAEQRWRYASLQRAFGRMAKVVGPAASGSGRATRLPHRAQHSSNGRAAKARPRGAPPQVTHPASPSGGVGAEGRPRHHRTHRVRAHRRSHVPDAPTGSSHPPQAHIESDGAHSIPSSPPLPAVTPPPSLPPPTNTIKGVALPTPRQAVDKSAAGGMEGEGESATDRRTAYLSYLRACLRQHRPPAPEVVEVARAHGDHLADGSLLALQIRTAEEQMGMLVLPAAAAVPAC